MRDNMNGTQLVHLGTLTLSGTTPGASSWADLKGFNAATIVMVNDTVTDAGTASGYTATVQHGDDTTASGAAAIDTADSVDGSTITITTTADAADNVVAGQVGYVGNKRYLRLNVVGTTLTDAVISLYAILTDASLEPTTYIGTKVAAT